MKNTCMYCIYYIYIYIILYMSDIISSYPIPPIHTVLSVTTATVLRITCCAQERPVPAILPKDGGQICQV